MSKTITAVFRTLSTNFAFIFFLRTMIGSIFVLRVFTPNPKTEKVSMLRFETLKLSRRDGIRGIGNLLESGKTFSEVVRSKKL